MFVTCYIFKRYKDTNNTANWLNQISIPHNHTVWYSYTHVFYGYFMGTGISYDCPNSHEANLKNLKPSRESWYNPDKTNHSKTVSLYHGTYSETYCSHLDIRRITGTIFIQYIRMISYPGQLETGQQRRWFPDFGKYSALSIFRVVFSLTKSENTPHILWFSLKS